MLTSPLRPIDNEGSKVPLLRPQELRYFFGLTHHNLFCHKMSSMVTTLTCWSMNMHLKRDAKLYFHVAFLIMKMSVFL